MIERTGGRVSSRHGLAALLTALLFGGLLAVGAAGPAGAGIEPPATGSISGTVTDAVTGLPVEGVEVRAYETSYFLNPQTTTTAADGTYTIGGLDGEYTLYFDDPIDYSVLSEDPFDPSDEPIEYVFEWYDDSPTEAASTRLVVGAVDTLVGIDAELAQAGSISGRATADLGRPVAGATVFVFQDGEIVLPKPDPNAPLGVVTRPDGFYVLKGLTPGIYAVRISAFGFPDKWAPGVVDSASATQVPVIGGQTTANIDFDLGEATGEISGSVQQLGDLAGEQLWVVTYRDGTIVDERPIEFGSFSIRNLAAGTYSFGFARQDPVTNVVGEPFEWYEDAADLASATPVLLGDGQVVSGIEVTLGEDEDPGETSESVFFSTSRPGRVGGLQYRSEDIVGFDPDSGEYSLYFDGSAAGLRRNVDAFALLDDGSVLVSMAQRTRLGDLGFVDDSDIVRFGPDGALPEIFLDGSDVGLTTNNEDIDSIAVTADGRLVVSTSGRANADGTTLAGQDLAVLNGAVFGSDSAGTWSVYLDGSEEKLQKSSERINGASIDAAGVVSLTTKGRFNVDGAKGTSNDVFECDGLSSGCLFHVTFRDLVNRPLDGLHIGPPASLAG